GDVGDAAAVRVVAAQLAVEQVDGVLVEVAGLEDVLVPLVLRHHRLAGEVVAGLLAQGVQREQAGQFGDGYGHGTWSGEVCPESIATFRLVVGPGPACRHPGKEEGPPFGGPSILAGGLGFEPR